MDILFERCPRNRDFDRRIGTNTRPYLGRSTVGCVGLDRCSQLCGAIAQRCIGLDFFVSDIGRLRSRIEDGRLNLALRNVYGFRIVAAQNENRAKAQEDDEHNTAPDQEWNQRVTRLLVLFFHIWFKIQSRSRFHRRGLLGRLWFRFSADGGFGGIDDIYWRVDISAQENIVEQPHQLDRRPGAVIGIFGHPP